MLQSVLNIYALLSKCEVKMALLLSFYGPRKVEVSQNKYTKRMRLIFRNLDQTSMVSEGLHVQHEDFAFINKNQE